MTNAFTIVHSVLDRFRGLPVKLSMLTGKSQQWFTSHGAEPKTQNPLSSGNVSAVDHYMIFARQYEAGATGAGRMLNRRVAEALEAEFSEREYNITHQPQIEADVLQETCDVSIWLAKFDVDKAERRDLVQFIDECKQAEDAIATARSSAQVRLRLDAQRPLAPPAEVRAFSSKGGRG